VNKQLNELKENTNKQMNEIKKIIQDRFSIYSEKKLEIKIWKPQKIINLK
jgi:hypothetical protein